MDESVVENMVLITLDMLANCFFVGERGGETSIIEYLSRNSTDSKQIRDLIGTESNWKRSKKGRR